jgi:hypothetical protein
MKTPNLKKYGLEFAGPRSSKRFSWRKWMLDLVICAVIMALLWVAFSLVSGARPESSTFNVERSTLNVQMAGFGASDTLAVVIVLGVCLALLVRLWWGARAEAADDPLNADGGVRAPEAMPEGLTNLDAALIVHACASRVGLIRSIVQGAQRPISDEDQVEALATAERLLGDLRVTLWELRAKFQTEVAPQRLEGRRDEALKSEALPSDFCGDLRPVPSTINPQPSTNAV